MALAKMREIAAEVTQNSRLTGVASHTVSDAWKSGETSVFIAVSRAAPGRPGLKLAALQLIR